MEDAPQQIVPQPVNQPGNSGDLPGQSVHGLGDIGRRGQRKQGDAGGLEDRAVIDGEDCAPGFEKRADRGLRFGRAPAGIERQPVALVTVRLVRRQMLL